MQPKTQIQIGKRVISLESPSYFVADVGANHDGSLERAIKLIHLAKEAGADAAKFQNFKAKDIVSDFGFRSLNEQKSHQANWKKSVFEVYEDASISQDWTPRLKAECDKVGIDYFSSPYDFQSVDHIDPFVEVYKIGSGDITWPEMIEYIARKGKPVLLACGAAELGDVQRAVAAVLKHNSDVVLMQCNTNYTGRDENFDFVQLRVLETFKAMYPGMILGLSDHTHGHATTLGAVALGARVIEKHFTDDNGREGPDHKFAMNPQTWREMVVRTRELERSLGTGNKRVEPNEQDSIVVQQRSIRAARDLKVGERIRREDLQVLRPAPRGCIKPYHLGDVVGSTVRTVIKAGDIVRWSDVEA